MSIDDEVNRPSRLRSGGGAHFADVVFRSGVLSSDSWLDIDGNGALAPQSDGPLLLRAMLGLNGTAATESALGITPRSFDNWSTMRDDLNTVCGLGLP